MPMIWAVYDAEGQKRALVEYAEDAAVLVAVLGDGTTICVGARVLWTEGAEKQPARESYDFVASLVHSRRESRIVQRLGFRAHRLMGYAEGEE